MRLISINEKPWTSILAICTVAWAGGGMWFFAVYLNWQNVLHVFLAWLPPFAIILTAMILSYRRESMNGGYTRAPLAKMLLGCFCLAGTGCGIHAIWQLGSTNFRISALRFVFFIVITLWVAIRAFSHAIRDLRDGKVERRWFLRIPGRKVFGPVTAGRLVQWAEQGRILPDNEVSVDRQNWVPAVSVPELNMCWFVVDGNRNKIGPVNRVAAEAFLKSGQASADACLIKGDGKNDCEHEVGNN